VKRPIVLVAIAILLVSLHAVLVSVMAHGHLAHVLLSGGRGSSSAAIIAAAFVVVRFLTIMVVPGLLFAAAADVVAYVLVGPRRGHSSVGAGISLADGAAVDAGTSSGGRGTE